MGKIGIVQWRLDHLGIEALYRATELGFNAIHIDAGNTAGNPLPNNISTYCLYQEAVMHTGITITAIAVNVLNQHNFFHSAFSSSAHKISNAIQDAIDMAAFLQVELILIPSFYKNEIRTRKELLKTAKLLQDACVYGKEQNVLIATENSLGVKENVELIQRIDHPSIRILFDTQNPVLWGHEPVKIIENLHGFFCNQVHIKDGCNGVMGNASLAKGQANVKGTLQALQRISFSGDMILENDYRINAEKLVLHDLLFMNTFSK